MEEQDKGKKTSFLSIVFSFNTIKKVSKILKVILIRTLIGLFIGTIIGAIFSFVTDGNDLDVVLLTMIVGFLIPLLTLLDIVTLKKPKWLKSPFGFIKRHAKVISGVILLSVFVIGGFIGSHFYYQSILSYEISGYSPQYTSYSSDSDKLSPEPLYITFEPSKYYINGEKVSTSVANLELLYNEVPSGITMNPVIEGTWTWDDNASLKFIPNEDWPAQQKYTVNFAPSIFKADVLLENNDYSFVTRDFDVKLQSLKLYQDPRVKSRLQLIATLRATHPIDVESIKQHLTLTEPLKGKDKGNVAEHKYKITFDKHKREVYVMTEQLKIKEVDSYVYFDLEKGVKPITGTAQTSEKIKSTLIIPSSDNFFKVNNSRVSLVKNDNDESEQTLILSFTDQISTKDVINKTHAYILPEKTEKGEDAYWYKINQITDAVLKRSKKIKLKAIPTPRDTATLHSFVFDVPENREIFVTIEKGLKSTNDFKMFESYRNILRTPYYPKEVQVMSEGAILSKNGDHKLSFLSRGLDDIEVTIARINKGQVNHLISQTRGRVTSANFNSEHFDEENISTITTKRIRLQSEHPKKAVYSSLDLTNKYSPSLGLGLFIVDVGPVNKKTSFSSKDRRLILITDLGMLVKNNADGSHDVFVQSVDTGKPVANSTVSLLAKNGLAILTVKTDARGHAYFPISKAFKKEQTPVAFVVTKGTDLSFIPYDRYDRTVNYSRFNIGGVSSAETARNKIDAFVFTSRGIYRPGDEVNFAAIVKNKDFSPLSNIPLEVKVTNPKNSVVYKKRIKLSPDGLIDFSFKTENSSITGNYNASVSLVKNKSRRQLGNTSFKVEEFQPDKLKIKSEFSEFKSKGWVTTPNFKAEVSLENLFGVPAQNRRITGDLILVPTGFYFQEYAKYKFSDAYYSDQKVMQKNVRLDDTKTDALGQASFDIDLKEYAAGTYRLNLAVQGYEEGGGRSVRANSAMLVSPTHELVGYSADGNLNYISKNSERTINFININSDLEKLSRQGLSLKLTQQQYISTLVQKGNGTYQYQSVRKNKLVKTEEFAIAQAGVDYVLPTKTPGTYYLEVVDINDAVLTKIYFTVIGKSNLSGKLEKNAELQVQLSKDGYRTGEEIEMSIVAPYVGAGLITIETNKVHAFKWFKTDTISSVQKIKLPAGIEGNAYVNVSFVRNVDSKEVFTSPLSYAVLPFSVDRSKRVVDLDLNVATRIKPGEELSIKYSSAKPSSIVLFAVDEGILQVANYKTPQPLNHFLQKRALEVNTMQIVDLILPAFRLVKNAAAAGGGMSDMKKSFESKQLNPFARKVEKPVAFWSGVLSADKNSKEHIFKIPDTFSGTLRVMAVAANETGVGVKEQKTLVRGPFVLTPNVLTSAAPGDEFDVVLGVANTIEGSGKKLPINIEITASEQLQIMGDTKRTLTITENSEETLKVKVKVLNKLGAASISFVASANDKSSRRTATLSIRPAITASTTFDSGFSESGKEKFDVKRRLYQSLSSNTLTASKSPLILIDGLIEYLNNYPHNSTMKMISASYPLLNYLEHPSYLGTVEQKYKRLNGVINDLRKRQSNRLGFTQWPAYDASANVTLYVMNFLLDAKEKGIAIPNDLWEYGFRILGKMARVPSISAGEVNLSKMEFSGLSNRNRAYAIYLLTRKGEVTTNYLVNLEKVLKESKSDYWKKDIVSVFIGSTYKLMKSEKKAEEFIENYEISKSDQTDSWGTYDSKLTHDSQYIYLLSRHFPTLFKDFEKEKLFSVINPIFEGNYDTSSSGWAVIALNAYTQAIMPKGVDETIKVTSVKTVNEQDQKEPLVLQTNPFPVANFFIDSERLELEAEAGSFYMLSQSGFDTKLPETANSNGVEISRIFIDDKGNEITDTVTQGQELTVILRVRSTSTKTRYNVAIVDLLPGGFEVMMDSIRKEYNGWSPSFKDIREDRVVFYGRFKEGMTEFFYKVKVTASGKFVVPPAYAEALFDSTVKANSEAGYINVTKPE